MPKWITTKKAAWGEIIVSIAVGGLSTYLNPSVGIPVFSVLLIIGVLLLVRAYKDERLQEIAVTDSQETTSGKLPSHEGYKEQWGHYDNIKEALLALQSASFNQAKDLLDTIQRERVYLDDAQLQDILV